MIDRLAALANGHARRVLAVAALFFVVAGVLGGGVADRLDPYGADDPDTESVIADEQLEQAGHRETGVIVLVGPEGRARVPALTERLRRDRDVASVTGFAETRSRAFLSRDRRSTYLAVALKPTADDELQDTAERLTDELAGEPGVKVGGPAVAQNEVNTQVEHDLRTAELYAFPLLFLLSLLFFRSLVAALLPLLVGGLAIVGTFLMLRVASEMTSISIFALNLVTGLGLGLAIDYSLFIVSRYREEIARDGAGPAAMRRTLATAGRTVLFSSLTVAGRDRVAGRLPAALPLLDGHRRLLRRADRGGDRADRAARGADAARRAGQLAHPGLSRPARRARCARHLGGLLVPPVAPRDALPRADRGDHGDAADRARPAVPRHQLHVGGPAGAAEVGERPAGQRRAALRVPALPGHADHAGRRATRGRAIAAAAAERARSGRGGRAAAAARRARTRSTWSPAPRRSTSAARTWCAGSRRLDGGALVTGATAGYLDLQASLVDHLPLVLAIVAAITILVLFAMTGSVILPIKQVLMNALGLSAVFGILVLIFQDGRFEGLLGYTSQGGLESTQPLLLFAVVFGLSTDYGVFLLARIKEARDAGHSDSEAVALGLERTGRIVTAAALLFCIAIGAFVTSQIIFIKELGLGTAIAVLIDATIIRALLVPSLMQLLGKWNWWAPAPLARLHRRFGLHEG